MLDFAKYLRHTRARVSKVAFWSAAVVRDVRGLWAPREHESWLTDVNIEPTNLCNANCVFCGYQFQETPHLQMNLDSARRIIEAARRAGIRSLGLTPIVGEPLIFKNLEEIVRIAKEGPAPMRVGVTTNGILLTPQRFESLLAAGLDVFSVSMCYPDEEEYRRIYRSVKLRTVVRNLEGILERFDPKRCAFQLGVRTPRIRWRHSLFDRAREAGMEVKRNLQFDDWSGKVSHLLEDEGLMQRPLRPKRLPCTMTFSGPHYRSDGSATACGCRDLDRSPGLALDPAELLEDMLGVYRHGAVARLREKFRERELPDVCATCRHYNPQYAGESLPLRLSQLVADLTSPLARRGIAPRSDLIQLGTKPSSRT